MDTIVLVHGFPLDEGMWDGLAEFLRGAGLKTRTMNLAGFGAGANAPEGLSMERWAGEVREIIEQECGGHAVVGGLSMGGYVVLELLRQWPEVAGGVILLDTKAGVDSAEGRAGREKAIETIKGGGRETFVEGLLGKLVAKGVSEEVKGQVREILLRQSAEVMVAGQRAMLSRRDQREVLREVGKKVPVLVVVGEEDVITGVEEAEAMRELSGGVLVRVAGAGHMPVMEKTGEVGGAIVAWGKKHFG